MFGPRQVVARINQDQVIAPQITLWNQQGSEVIQGTLMVIPIEESLIYVRPLYLRAQAGRIPELTRVIVAYQNQIVMERTLEAGLARIFGRRRRRRRRTAPGATGAPRPTPADGRRIATKAHWNSPVTGRDLAAEAHEPPTIARSPRNGPATGRSTARRSGASAKSSAG